MNLLLLFFLVTLALFTVFWGGSLVVQGYLYQQPADRLPARAAIAAGLVGGFITFWVSVDRRNPEKYGTFFEFSGEKRTAFGEFEAVRWQRVPAAGAKKVEYAKNDRGQEIEKVAKVSKHPGGKASAVYIEEGSGKPFQLSGSFPPDNLEMQTVAVVVKGEDGTPVRFNATLDKDARTGGLIYPRDENRRRFVEEKGSRYIPYAELEHGNGAVNASNTSVIVAALLLNVLLFVVWLAAFWPLLRFHLWHGVGLALAFGLITMLLVMPLLFKGHRAKPAAVVAAMVKPVLGA